jgi:hypothetical protein
VSRRLEDWIEAFVKHTEGIPSPPRFRRWAALSTVAAAMGRRTRTRWGKKILHPNLFIFLVGPAGGGKTMAIATARDEFLVEMKTINICPASITGRAFLGLLARDKAKDVTITQAGVGGSFETHTAIAVFISELATFYTEGDRKFLSDLTDIYDNPPKYDHLTQTSGEARIERPCVNIIGGTTVPTLTRRFSETTLEEGFPSRVLLVYDETKIKLKIFEFEDAKTDYEALGGKEKDLLLHDLQEINNLSGRFRWEQDAQDTVQGWEDHGLLPAPTDPRFNKYLNRRITHIAKMCLSICASRSNDLIVNLADVRRAREMLLDMESNMAQCISYISESNTYDQMKLVQRVVHSMYDARKKPIFETKLWQSICNKIGARDYHIIVEAVINAEWISSRGAPPNRMFAPANYNWLSQGNGKDKT